MFGSMHVTDHRDGDDLLTAGLGLGGLRAMVAPEFVDAERPTPAELRRRALWSNWRGIADLAPGGGYGEIHGSTAAVPGREYSALATLPGARQPHRVLTQVPDTFDMSRRCIVVTASSGSRGIYGAIAVAGAWGLPRGCAVAYTDKGAGTDYFDLDAGQGVRADGSVGHGDPRSSAESSRIGTGHVVVDVDANANADAAFEERLAFVPDVPAHASGIASKHAHSGDNPEADWGRHVQQAAQFALQALDRAFPQVAPFTFDNTRVIAVGISNGGGAVLRAAELAGSRSDGSWLDGVVAGEPSVHVAGGRSLYDYATQAALLMPCALLDPALAPMPQPPFAAQVGPSWAGRCASLAAAGLVEGNNVIDHSRSAHAQLADSGWTDEALRAGALAAGFDLWRAVAVTYASAYGRYGVDEHPCGYSFAAMNPDFSRRAATAVERVAWIADGNGNPPGAGVGIVDPGMASPDGMSSGPVVPDPAFAGLLCLRALATGGTADALRMRAGIEEIRAGAPRPGLPVIVIHGLNDGLVPPAFTSAPYVAMAQASGGDVRFWQIRNVQHFDGFLGLPDYAARYLPLLPYVYAALDRVMARLDHGAPLPDSAVISTTPRGAGKPLQASDLAIPR